MNKNSNQKLNWSVILPLLLTILGTILLVYMIKVEDEPGALPLILIVTGIVLLTMNWFKSKRSNNQ
ncbi:MAG: hypothetical protein V4666_03370 [Bacteroidota bacterium]